MLETAQAHAVYDLLRKTAMSVGVRVWNRKCAHSVDARYDGRVEGISSSLQQGLMLYTSVTCVMLLEHHNCWH
jgi:hypothetical protein